MKDKRELIDIVFSFDTTGSMYPCLTQVRRTIEETVKKLFKDIPNIRIGIIAHGDYCDKDRSYVIKMLDLTDDQKEICNFIKNVEATGGGDEDECYELVLHEARRLSWTAGRSRLLVLIGDACPHDTNYPDNKQKLDWRNELDMLTESNIKVYGVQALNRHYAASFYQEMAKRTGGFHLSLNQFSQVVDLIMAVSYKQVDDAKLLAYAEMVKEKGRMDRGLSTIFGVLTGRKEIVKFKERDLESVDPGRFQVLDVDDDSAIKEFVEDNGLLFRLGRGFYEFTKRVLVQENKEVILVDNHTGDMFSGKKARVMIGLPFGKRGNVSPGDGNLKNYTAFIQSTSANRKLLKGTKFLYEVDSSR